MTDEAKLIVNTLRECAVATQCSKCVVFCGNDECLFTAAAKMIESLSAELERYDEAITNSAKIIESAYKQRDAAIEDLRGRCFACKYARPHEIYPKFNVCQFISSAVGGQGVRECEHWQWRGVKEE